VSRVRSRRAVRSPFGTRRLSPLRAADAYLVFLGLLIFARAMLLVSCGTIIDALEPDTTGASVPAARTNGRQFSARVDMVQVTATVLHGRRFVRGLPREAFRVFEDEVPRPVTYFAAENVPLELVVAVDVSSSMRKAIGQVKENAAHFLAALPSSDQVTLVSFNDELHVLANPSMPLAGRLEAITPLVPFGMTSLYDVIVRSFDYLGRQVGRRGVVMFTDGEDTSSHVSSDTVERRAETSDAVVYVMGHGQALKSPTLRELCERLASKSGGRAFFPREMNGLRRAFDTVLEELCSQYLLVYEPRSNKPDGRWHRIRVEAGNGYYEVRARQGYRYDAVVSRQ
jgi:Ca-activated chloride channel family protein